MEENEHDSKTKKFEELIERKQMRMMHAKNSTDNIWINFTTFGALGWTITAPTIIGVAVGTWLDHSQPNDFSWTLMLMSFGLLLGLMNSWRWIEKERQYLIEDAAMQETEKKKEEETK